MFFPKEVKMKLLFLFYSILVGFVSFFYYIVAE